MDSVSLFSTYKTFLTMRDFSVEENSEMSCSQSDLTQSGAQQMIKCIQSPQFTITFEPVQFFTTIRP